MSYIGNAPISAAFLVDTFSGTGSQTAFTMTVAPANTSSIIVAVTGVLQDPSTYSVSGTTLTFSAAPPSGTSNISVRYLGIPASGVTTTAYRTVTNFTATAGQTSFSVPSYTVGYIDVYRNGVRLVSTDYTATTGTTVVLANACTAGDAVVTESFLVSSVLNAIPATAGAVAGSYLAGGAARSNWGAGGVLQVVNATYGTQVSSSTNTFVDTGLTATITPSSATSKILIFVDQAGCSKDTGNTSLQLQLLRGSTQIVYMDDIGAITSSTASNECGSIGTNYLDSPSTTSAVTYKTQFRSRSNIAAVYVQAFGSTTPSSTITLMEIAA
jgi:hypothetical protein